MTAGASVSRLVGAGLTQLGHLEELDFFMTNCFLFTDGILEFMGEVGDPILRMSDKRDLSSQIEDTEKEITNVLHGIKRKLDEHIEDNKRRKISVHRDMGQQTYTDVREMSTQTGRFVTAMCGICGIEVVTRNLPRHIDRHHPGWN